MKAMQLREMNDVELKAKLEDNLEALQNLRFQQALQQLEDKTVIQKTKRILQDLLPKDRSHHKLRYHSWAVATAVLPIGNVVMFSLQFYCAETLPRGHQPLALFETGKHDTPTLFFYVFFVAIHKGPLIIPVPKRGIHINTPNAI